MAICTIGMEFINCWKYLALASPHKLSYIDEHYSHKWCVVKGFILQYFEISTVTWNFILSVSLFRILYFSIPLEKIGDSMKYYHIFVWSTCLISSIIPLFAPKKYGYTYVNNLYTDELEYDCWIQNGTYQLCLYAPLIIYYCFGFCVMFYCIFKIILTKSASDLNIRLIMFTFAFMISWIGAVIDRIVGIVIHNDYIDDKNNYVPSFIIWLHNIGVASIGLCDAIVWGTSKLWNPNEFYNVLTLAAVRSKRGSRGSKSNVNSIDSINTEEVSSSLLSRGAIASAAEAVVASSDSSLPTATGVTVSLPSVIE